MPNCDCDKYPPLELLRESINGRIRQSRALHRRLAILGRHPGHEHILYQCPVCQQTWQGSRAWNWGNDEYLFAVPQVPLCEWMSEPYVQPDELLIFVAVMRDFLERQTWEPTERACGQQGCPKAAIKLSAFCREHHVANLQRSRLLPASPSGRWFDPYRAEGFALPTDG